jgi:hypothetical protein
MQDSRYRKGSRKIGDSFRAAGGIPRALEEIDAFMQRHARRPK